MRMRIHVPEDLLPTGLGLVPLLEPFYERPRYDPEGNWAAISSEYFRRSPDLFQIVSHLAEADLAVLPVDWGSVEAGACNTEAVHDLIRKSQLAGVPLLIFDRGDAPAPVDWPRHAVVLRIAAQRRTVKANEHIIPQWSRDYLISDYGGELRSREKPDIPVVSFCGYAPPLALGFGRRLLKETAKLWAHRMGLWRFFPQQMGHATRVRAILRLRRSKRVRTELRVRGESAFDNPIGAFLPGGTVESAEIRRREFAENLIGGDYPLCARGWANCSLRFFEVLSLGRVPLLIETDNVLPWRNEIDWDRYRIAVPEARIGEIEKRVLEFHGTLSPDEYLARQRECRDLFDRWLSPHGFFGNLHRLFKLPP